MIRKSGERGSGISVLPARHDDDYDDITDGISLESKRLQISSGLQDSSQYSDQFQQFHNLDGLSILPLISNFSNHLSKALETLLSVPVTIGITVTFMFHSLFSSLAGSKYFSLFSLSLNFPLWSAGTAKFTIPQVLFFVLFFLFFLFSFLFIYWIIFVNYHLIWFSSLLVRVRGSVCISNSQRLLCI